MKDFIFNNPVKVYFGKDQLQAHLAEVLGQYGKNVLLVYGGGSIKKIGLYDRLTELLKDFNVTELAGVEPNPRTATVDKGADLCKANNIDVILAVGGGSTIDCCKIIAATAKKNCKAWDIVIGKEAVEDALPLVDILTLAATGSEMDAGGVISNPETSEKRGKSDPKLFPKASFLDPTLTYSVSKYQTACGSADIMSHIMETYFDFGTMEFLASFMEGMLRTVIQYAPVALKEPENYEARANLMWISSWAINGFARATQEKGWSVHSMEHQLSAVYDITHGLGLAILTPSWLRYIMEKDSNTVALVARFGRNVFDLGGEDEDVAREAVSSLEDFLFDELGLDRTLTAIGIDDTHFEAMAEKACNNSVLNGIVPLTKEDIMNIYKMCL